MERLPGSQVHPLFLALPPVCTPTHLNEQCMPDLGVAEKLPDMNEVSSLLSFLPGEI